MSADPVSPLALICAKLFGAVAGSAISVAYLLPAGPREAAVRFAAGAVMGLVFGGPAGLMLAEHFDVARSLSPVELALIGSAATSLCAWGALGVLSRFADGLFPTQRNGPTRGSGR